MIKKILILGLIITLIVIIVTTIDLYENKNNKKLYTKTTIFTNTVTYVNYLNNKHIVTELLPGDNDIIKIVTTDDEIIYTTWENLSMKDYIHTQYYTNYR